MVQQSYLVDNIFDRIIQQGMSQGLVPGKTREAIEWYRNRAKQVSYANVNTLMRSESAYLVDGPQPGKLVLYKYDAKLKDTLPYWDAVPLIFVVDVTEKGWYGLNLHYLEPRLRAKLMDALYPYMNNKKYDDSTRLKISYQILKSAASLKYFQPCFKQYLADHVKSPFMEIPATDWEISLFLPLAKWKKKTGNFVYAQSNKMING
jgi:hypothetical protein